MAKCLHNPKISPILDTHPQVGHFLFSLFSFRVSLEPIPKIVSQIRGVFSFGGALAWDPSPSCPLPPKKKRRLDLASGSVSNLWPPRLRPAAGQPTRRGAHQVRCDWAVSGHYALAGR